MTCNATAQTFFFDTHAHVSSSKSDAGFIWRGGVLVENILKDVWDFQVLVLVKWCLPSVGCNSTQSKTQHSIAFLSGRLFGDTFDTELT